MMKTYRQFAVKNKRTILIIGSSLLFAVVGFVLLQLSSAATPSVAIEAESGTKTGTVAGDTNGASGGASVKFMANTPTGGGGGGTSKFGPGPLSGLAWHSGVHAANEIDKFNLFGDWRGRPLDAYVLFTPQNSWGDIENLSNAIERVSGSNLISGIATGPKVNKDAVVAISTPLYAPGGSYGACANGDYDGHWKAVGTKITNAGWNKKNMVLRLSWEFNGNWYYWSVGSNVDAFKGCWSKAVKALRTTANAVTIDWNWNGHYSQSCNHSIFSCYPGDDVVDIIGIDSYDMYPSSGSSNESWAAYCRASGEGLCNAADFARQHGKMISVPEWGISNQSENPGVRGKDNPAYMQNMYNFFTDNKDIMAYESYYNAPLSVEPGNVGSGIWPGASVDGVNASAKYKQLFGK